jgi:hypothetical protein
VETYRSSFGPSPDGSRIVIEVLDAWAIHPRIIEVVDVTGHGAGRAAVDVRTHPPNVLSR